MNSFELVVSSQWSVVDAGGRALESTDYGLLSTDFRERK